MERTFRCETFSADLGIEVGNLGERDVKPCQANDGLRRYQQLVWEYDMLRIPFAAGTSPNTVKTVKGPRTIALIHLR